jgi:hypothetical protein
VRRQRDDLLAVSVEEWIGRNKEGFSAGLGQSREGYALTRP